MKRIGFFALILAASSASAIAQDDGPSEDQAFAYIAIVMTPLGALPPLATQAPSAPRGLTVAASYGRMDLGETPVNNFGGTIDFGAGVARVGLTAGYLSPDCPSSEDCKGHFMIGGGFRVPLASGSLGQAGETYSIGVDASVNAGFPEDARLLAIGASLPIRFEVGQEALRVIPFLSPGIAWGRSSVEDNPFFEGQSFSALRVMLGGGFGLRLQSGVGINVGVQKVFIERGEMLLGAGLTWSPRM